MISAILALALLGGQDAAPRPPDTLPDIVVQPLSDDAIGRFIGGITVPGEHGRFVGQVARWDHRLCVSVVGGASDVNAYLTEQIAANFRSLDIPHAAPGCAPTVAVVISTDADAFARTFARRNRNHMFSTRGEALTRFLGPSRPVRWRHLTRTDQRALPQSRLRVATTRAIQQTIIVVDAERAAAAPLDSLAAYLAFIALVDLPAEPSTGGQRTILSLFDESAAARPRALTRWDRAFIEALYRVTPDMMFGLQQAEIENWMRHNLTTTPRVPVSTGGDTP
ncbi:hypothetical protein [Brevundimonas sp.]|uniref:hypothetical protein n=1 Tax=Brevundimonas sp. TaxID=1871086 RepID=UPI002737B2A2|nr:hypothetical protein [Brevundimonas sp.]